jgi:hypothetical protein
MRAIAFVLLMLMTCSFPVNTALRIAIAFLKHLDLRERDSIPRSNVFFLERNSRRLLSSAVKYE